jgi:hypothetical protein
MTSGVQATVSQPAMMRRSPQLDLLLRHCLAFEYPLRRPPARVRLEEAVGPALARRLVTSLTAGRR